MATLALTAVGAAAGSALLPAGVSLFGASIAGATLGSQVGALAGAQIDQALFGGAGRGRSVDGPRLSDLSVTTSTEGAHIPRLYGRARLGGQVIWATALEEEAVERSAAGGGKGARASASASGTDYAYFANFAVALCEGPVTSLGRVWADGREIDLADYTYRFYRGDEAQDADPLIVGRQGSDAPAYRGIAYVVFEHMPLAAFANRIPQLSFEVSRAVDTLERDIKGVVLIPGSGEFVYAQSPVERTTGRISSVPENTHTSLGGTDWSVSLDQLQADLPNATSVSLVVSWFGDDLRANQCRIRPLVESSDKVTTPAQWSVAGLTRSSAGVVSRNDGRAAYGGTPSDDTVISSIRDLRARGLSVVLSPFILMDIPAANTLGDPYSAASSQPAYPWRGRITVAPAAGRPGTPDKTALAASHLAAFIGSAAVSDFSVSGDSVLYSGPAEWSFRRFILHHAHLAKAAGGVDAFVLCSELRGLTTVRAAGNTFPFVSALMQLAADVRGILGPSVKILYAADWSEYFGHQPADGSGDVFFHLDPLWSSPHVDCIGLDVYWPLADWRRTGLNLDAASGVSSIYDPAYLKANLAAGEGYDWYYASAAARAAQDRTPITDGAGKPWVFRNKDLVSWWSQAHYNRPGGTEAATPTAWVPQSKPFWFLEIGCPAVDLGANQPNVFVDAKSAESALPYFSSGARDDLMQRRVLQAIVEAYTPTHAGFVPALNPLSAVYGGRMVDAARIHVYCWDSRPYPAFPNRIETWGDGENWRLGHWINGRTASAPVPALVAAVLADYGFADGDARALVGTVGGLVVDRIMSARQALQPLEIACFFDSLESGGRIVFRPRGAAASCLHLTPDDLVETRSDRPLLQLTRGQETDLPASSKVTYVSATGDYAQASSEARRAAGGSARTSQAALGLVLDTSDADAIADRLLFEAWASRDRAAFALPPSRLALEPADTLTITANGRANLLRVTEVGEHVTRDIEARSIDPAVYVSRPGRPRNARPPATRISGAPLLTYLDCPPDEDVAAHDGLVAAAREPWPGEIAVFRSAEDSGYELATLLGRAAVTGLTTLDLPIGVVGRLDLASRLTVAADRGVLTSASQLALLGGANMAALEIAPNQWEVLQFQTATLVAPRTYQLSTLLRGMRGTEHDVVVPAGARFLLLDAAVRPLGLSPADIGLALNWRAGPARLDIGAAAFITTPMTFTGKGTKPLAPVHVRASRTSGGDLSLTWVRRTRSEGDSWATLDVPLGETSEAYALDILAGSLVKRTFSLSTPSVVYSAADQTADFGSPQSAITLRLAQVSPTYGRGTSRLLTL